MKFKRVLSVYDKTKDNLIEEIDLTNIQIAILLAILKPSKDDPEAFKVYSIAQEQFYALAEIVPSLSKFSLDGFDIFYECFTY